MATKAAHTAFNRSVAAYLQSIGAEAKSNTIFHGEWVLKTLAGDLNISLHEPERSEVFSIYGRFTGGEKVHETLRLLYCGSTYSYKWNFHSYDAKELLEEFKEQIQPLLIKTLTT